MIQALSFQTLCRENQEEAIHVENAGVVGFRRQLLDGYVADDGQGEWNPGVVKLETVPRVLYAYQSF